MHCPRPCSAAADGCSALMKLAVADLRPHLVQHHRDPYQSRGACNAGALKLSAPRETVNKGNTARESPAAEISAHRFVSQPISESSQEQAGSIGPAAGDSGGRFTTRNPHTPFGRRDRHHSCCSAAPLRQAGVNPPRGGATRGQQDGLESMGRYRYHGGHGELWRDLRAGSQPLALGTFDADGTLTTQIAAAPAA